MISRVMIVVLALIFVIAYISEARPVMDGLVAYWTFDEADMDGDVVKDIIGGHDGEIFGDPEIVPGKGNEALEFNGVDDSVGAEIPDGLLAGGITLELWLRQEEPTGFSVMVQIDPGGLTLQMEEGLAEFWSAAANGGIEGARGGRLSDGNWHHVAGTVDKDFVMLYINGVYCGRSVGGATFDFISTVTIGGPPGGGGWPGEIDEVRIYGRPLSEEEINHNMGAIGISVKPADKLAETWGKIKFQAG